MQPGYRATATTATAPTNTSVNTITTTNKSNLSHDLSPFAPLFRNFCARLTLSDRFRTSTLLNGILIWMCHHPNNGRPIVQLLSLLGMIYSYAMLTHLNCCVYRMCTENLPNFANVDGGIELARGPKCTNNVIAAHGYWSIEGSSSIMSVALSIALVAHCLAGNVEKAAT